MENTQQVLWVISAIMCDKVIDPDTDAESYDKETKKFATNFNEKKYAAK